MAEALAVISLINNIASFADIAVRCINRLKEFDETSSDYARSLSDVKAQLPLLLAITNDISIDCQKRCQAGRVEGTSKRDQHLVGTVEGLGRQVQALDDILVTWAPRRHSLGGEKGNVGLKKLFTALQSFSKDKQIAAIEERIETYKSLLILNFSMPVGEPFTIPQQGASYNVLPRFVSRFVGRQSVLEKISAIHDLLQPKYRRQVVVLHGMGGQGKTQTALQYTHAFLNAYSNAKVVWLDAVSPESVLRSFEKVHDLMKLSEHHMSDQKVKRARVLQEMSNWTDPWLLVFDNYDNPNKFGNIAEHFPLGLKGAVLFTTRTAQVGARLGHPIELDAMGMDEGVDLLIHRSGHTDDNASRAEAREIVTRLGNLPLAIDQAAAYIRARKLPLKDFWIHFNSRRKQVLSHVPAGDWNYQRSMGPTEAERSLSVFTTWELSLREADSEAFNTECIERFLTFSSFLDSSMVSDTLFQGMTLRMLLAKRTTASTRASSWLNMFVTDSAWDPFLFQDIVAQCYDLSLIQSFNMDGAKTSFMLHPLIGDWLRLRIDSEARWQTLQEVATSLSSYVNLNQDERRTLPNRNPIGPDHKAEIMSYIDDCLRHESSVHDLMSGKHFEPQILRTFASVLWAVDRWHDVQALVEKALNLSKSLKGDKAVATLRVMQDKADIQSQLDELDRADDNYRYILSALEANPHGDEKLLFLQATFGLGLIHRRRGDFVSALDVLGRSVAGAEAEGLEKHLTVDWYSNLGYVLWRTSQQAEAERVLRSAIQTCMDHDLRLLLEHIWPLNWLIRLLCSQGRFEEADEMWQEEYPLVLARHGPEGWETVFMDELLGIMLWKKGDLAAGKTRIEAAREAFLGMYFGAFDVEEVLEATHFLGEIALAQNKLPEARKLLSDSADGWERMCGVGTAHCLEVLGAYLEVLVRLEQTTVLEQTLSRTQLALDRISDQEAPIPVKVRQQVDSAQQYLANVDHQWDSVSPLSRTYHNRPY